MGQPTWAPDGHRIAFDSDRDGNLAPWYHTHEDVPERVDGEALTRATDFLVSLVRLMDRDAGRGASSQPPAVTAERV